MSEIRVLSVTAKNFLTIKTPIEYQFSNKGLVGVFGLNGNGKSSMFVETLNYALFGVSERYGKSRDQIINRFVGKDCHVGVKLSMDDLLVEVDAYRKDSKHRDNVYLKLNGVDKRGNNNDQTWDKIIRLLDMDYLAFTNSVIFGQALSQYFSGLTDASQKEIVERLLGITWIPDAQRVAKADTSLCLTRYTEAEHSYNEKIKKIDNFKNEIENFKLEYTEFENQRKEKLIELKRQYETVVDTIELEKKIMDYSAKKVELDELMSAATSGIREQEKKIFKIDAEISSAKKDLQKIERFLRGLEILKIGDRCEVCGQTITNISEKQYKDHLEKDKSEINSELSKLSSEKDDVTSGHVIAELELKEIQIETTEINKLLVSFKTSLTELQLKNARVEEKNKYLDKNIQDTTTAKNPYEELIGKKVAELKTVENDSLNAKSYFISLRDELKYHEFWEEGFSNRGMKSFIIESATPQMNAFANLYSKALGGKFNISFSAQQALKKGELREKFYVDVNNKVGSLTYEGNSSGERRAIDSIIMFVLGDLAASRSSKRFSILILDDIFEKLDEEICDSIIRVLYTMVSPNTEGLPRRESIFVLTHLEYFKSKFQNRIFVERKNGETVYRED